MQESEPSIGTSKRNALDNGDTGTAERPTSMVLGDIEASPKAQSLQTSIDVDHRSFYLGSNDVESYTLLPTRTAPGVSKCLNISR